MSDRPLQVTVFSDYICPFCYVGDARLDALRRELDLEVQWHWFEIHPETPEAGMPVTELGYPPERWQRMVENLQAMALEEGLPLAPTTFTTNSHKALLLAAGARALAPRVFERLHKRIFAAYFVDARNIGDAEVLRDVAHASGVDEEVVARAWSDPIYEQTLHVHTARSARLGVGGVPAFLFGRHLVAGAVPTEVLRQAAREALRERSQEQ